MIILCKEPPRREANRWGAFHWLVAKKEAYTSRTLLSATGFDPHALHHLRAEFASLRGGCQHFSAPFALREARLFHGGGNCFALANGEPNGDARRKCLILRDFRASKLVHKISK